VKRGLASLCAVASLTLVAACGDDDSGASPSATLEPAPTTSSTTSTTVLTVEQEVEAAYLLSWEIYAEAVLTFDTSRLEEAYAGRALEIVRADVTSLREDGTPARMEVEHNYAITVEPNLAVVVDNYVNHSVLLDGATGEPIEADPNEVLHYIYSLREIEGVWKVIDIVRSP